MGYNGEVQTNAPSRKGLALRWGAGVALFALLLVLFALRPAHAARTLDCRPGARHVIEGAGPPRTALLLLFDGDPIGGGLTGADGAYRIPLVVGSERPGIYPVEVVRRDTRAVLDSLTCVVPSPDAPAPQAPAATQASAPTLSPPPTAIAPSSTRAAVTPTVTRTSTVTPQPTATLRPGESSPTASPTGSPTVTATTTQTTGPTSQTGNGVLEIDELDSEYFESDDISVVGTLLDSTGDGIPSIPVTVRYTINGVDAGAWCMNAVTDQNGDWECPDQTAQASWLNKTIRITVSVTVQGRTLTDSIEFRVVADEET
jgi:hypothetical protein